MKLVFYSFEGSKQGIHLTWDTAGWVSDSDEVEQENCRLWTA